MAPDNAPFRPSADQYGVGWFRRQVLRALELAWFKVAGPEGKGYDTGLEDGRREGRKQGQREGFGKGFEFTRGMSVKAMQTWAEEFSEQASVGRKNFQRAAEKLGQMTDGGWFPKFYG